MAGLSLPFQSLGGNRRGLQSRLIRVFAIQATLVSFATILGVFAAYKIAEDYLVHQALKGEAEHFWALWESDQTVPLPDTRNMKAYLSGRDGQESGRVPAVLQSLDVNFYGRTALAGREPLVMVSERDQQRLYLVFKEEQVSRLAFFFGIAPLTVVLILIYMASWFTFRQSQRLISPITKLAEIVDSTGVRAGGELSKKLEPFGGIDADIDALVMALNHYTDRIQQFVKREQTFTRDASHELRTPLAVMRGSLDILENQTDLAPSQQKVLGRMRQSVQDMEGLIETLLFLAREDGLEPTGELCAVNALVPLVVGQLRDALKQPDTPVEIRETGALKVDAPERVFQIILGNLLRNALLHGQGKGICVRLSADSLAVEDQGPGMDAKQLAHALTPFYRGQTDVRGYGLGLAIVKRLCDRFGWQLDVRSQPGEGTHVLIRLLPEPA